MCDKVHYDDLEARVTSLETTVSQMRGECQRGFTQLNESVQHLAADFGTRMNTLDARLVEEKAAWGKTFRSLVTWTVKALLVTSMAAAGVNLAKGMLQ